MNQGFTAVRVTMLHMTLRRVRGALRMKHDCGCLISHPASDTTSQRTDEVRQRISTKDTVG